MKGLWRCCRRLFIMGAIALSLIWVSGSHGSQVGQIHPLPAQLAQWEAAEDYFEAVNPTRFGYLVWWQFPVKVYLQAPPEEIVTAGDRRAQNWWQGVHQAVQEWNAYLPLLEVDNPSDADIQVWRSLPPVDRTASRARSAQTSYKFYKKRSHQGVEILAHRMSVYLSPGLRQAQTLAAARHELGHALGIWGHSPSPEDALYFAQVADPPPISHRDISTLKRVYQQPTCLGWPLSVISHQ